MFRRTGVIGKQVRDLGVKFCDGCGISTSVERSARRLEAVRTAAVLSLPRV
ncbi:hypothetical protein Caci_8613 [Catenulispora acidiphila DSM 44928]|uniref:Uncharacterized protein n=1 Tax=Catenulispora acidiphila (strain DSM 44928 / JCM 14897 / NBRC 102108 / NRRL B-24433 / ID139908) TaxID=479433 RepID=C7Q099_CATAD|nr:hypothetical protein [Catenulispora acidiphila]ACU77432.1 hypothetical protein Caci_8613 [Catenulispora acidiphila DSM 44928]